MSISARIGPILLALVQVTGCLAVTENRVANPTAVNERIHTERETSVLRAVEVVAHDEREGVVQIRARQWRSCERFLVEELDGRIDVQRATDEPALAAFYILGALAAGLGAAVLIDAPNVADASDPGMTNPLGRDGAYALGVSLSATGLMSLTLGISNTIRANDSSEFVGERRRRTSLGSLECDQSVLAATPVTLEIGSRLVGAGVTDEEGLLEINLSILAESMVPDMRRFPSSVQMSVEGSAPLEVRSPAAVRTHQLMRAAYETRLRRQERERARQAAVEAQRRRVEAERARTEALAEEERQREERRHALIAQVRRPEEEPRVAARRATRAMRQMARNLRRPYRRQRPTTTTQARAVFPVFVWIASRLTNLEVLPGDANHQVREYDRTLAPVVNLPWYALVQTRWWRNPHDCDGPEVRALLAGASLNLWLARGQLFSSDGFGDPANVMRELAGRRLIADEAARRRGLDLSCEDMDQDGAEASYSLPFNSLRFGASNRWGFTEREVLLLNTLVALGGEEALPAELRRPRPEESGER